MSPPWRFEPDMNILEAPSTEPLTKQLVSGAFSSGFMRVHGMITYSGTTPVYQLELTEGFKSHGDLVRTRTWISFTYMLDILRASCTTKSVSSIIDFLKWSCSDCAYWKPKAKQISFLTKWKDILQIAALNAKTHQYDFDCKKCYSTFTIMILIVSYHKTDQTKAGSCLLVARCRTLWAAGFS